MYISLLCFITLLVFGIPSYALAQPTAHADGILFTYAGESASSVSLVGDFNGWSKDEDPLTVQPSGKWTVVRKVLPGIYQYKFVLDGHTYENDPFNPVTIENYNRTGMNSVFVLTEDHEVLLTAEPPKPRLNPSDDYPLVSGAKPVHLNIIWHQHQPLYVNPETDQLEGPWVRTHATKDYYDMAAMLREYPNVHCNINLTSSLLHQLREYYVNRLKPFVNVKKNRVDARAFWKRWKGKTDPWIDLALKPTQDFDETDKGFLYKNMWNAFGISEVMIERFPQYLALKKRLEVGQPHDDDDLYNEQEMREIKFWFYLAYFDPDFLRGPVKLPDGSTCDLSDYLEERQDRKFHLRKKVTEEDCNRIVAEAFKVMVNVIPAHRDLQFNAHTGKGQVEIITTPYYHPILPLIYDTDLARTCQPSDRLPPRFSYPQDAHAQVVKSVNMYREIFGVPPTGMWPGEGSVAQPVLDILRRNGIVWTASDVKVLARSDPPGQPNVTPYSFPAGNDGSIAIVFRDTELSDRIGFKYQNYQGEAAAEDFVRTILSHAPREGQEDVLITVILDGENAWEWYRYDNDGKEFLNSLYRKLSKLYESRQIITTTTFEYLTGNLSRGISPHPVDGLPKMKWLWPGSWINANYDTWIGEEEENVAWEYLLRVREDLEASGIPQPDPGAPPLKKQTKAWYGYMAWEAMYAAEGSDWFWWYGNDQSAPAGDQPFDKAFRTHLRNVYTFARLAGSSIVAPEFHPIITEEVPGGQGVMAQSRDEMQSVVFECDVAGYAVPERIYIVGNTPLLGMWTPNAITMYDDGTNGDTNAGDAIWSLEVHVPIGMEIQYKYTNSGRKGSWVPGEEFPVRHRTFVAKEKSPTRIVIRDIFGQ